MASNWETFKIAFPEISFAVNYTSRQRSHTKSIFDAACELLTSFVHRDVNVLRFWCNISDGIYAHLTSTMTDNEILSVLIQEPTSTGPTKLAEMIASVTIYIPHPDENICKSRFGFNMEHASTYREGDASVTIFIHPNVFDLAFIRSGNSREFFPTILHFDF